jgi:predicted SAM-dependent methyltransferase
MVMRVLNVGGGASRNLPPIYRGWEQELLDIDPAVRPDIVCDARKMRTLPAQKYDAVYCSHALEHFYKHEVPAVLDGFQHVLKNDGFAHVAVPNMTALFTAVRGRDIDETWYMSNGGPISFHDVIYGWGRQVEQGNAYYAHKTGFTEKSLGKALRAAGFVKAMTAVDEGNLFAFAFKAKPTTTQLRRLGL